MNRREPKPTPRSIHVVVEHRNAGEEDRAARASRLRRLRTPFRPYQRNHSGLWTTVAGVFLFLAGGLCVYAWQAVPQVYSQRQFLTSEGLFCAVPAAKENDASVDDTGLLVADAPKRSLTLPPFVTGTPAISDSNEHPDLTTFYFDSSIIPEVSAEAHQPHRPRFADNELRIETAPRTGLPPSPRWFPAKRPLVADSDVRRPGPITSSGIPIPSDYQLHTGMYLQVEWRGNWWLAEVKEVGPTGQVAIHYVGWEDTWDEIVSRDRLQLDFANVPIHSVSHKTIESTIHSPRDWGPEQVLGPPNTLTPGDKPTAWASSTQDGADEWLILEYEHPVHVVGVLVYESFNPGAVAKVTLWNQEGTKESIWNRASWDRESTARDDRHIAVIPVDVNFATQRIKLDIASKSVPGWNEIDAVGLIDDAGKTHWAIRCEASSAYGDTHNVTRRAGRWFR